MTAVIYALADAGLADCCKIGKDANWPRRFRQAQSHTPRGIRVLALWEVDHTELGRAEKRATQGLHKRAATPAIEWYDGPIDVTIERVTANLGIQPIIPNAVPAVRPYDDWRSLPREDRGFRKRLWVHVEASHRPRIKVIPSVLLDTAYQYTFTYNPWPVYLIAAYQSPNAATNGRHDEANDSIWKVWEALIARYGTGVPTTSIGWLNEGTELSVVEGFIAGAKLVPYDLTSPKPQDAPSKDPSVPRVEYGCVPSLRRVRSAEGFFGAWLPHPRELQ